MPCLFKHIQTTVKYAPSLLKYFRTSNFTGQASHFTWQALNSSFFPSAFRLPTTTIYFLLNTSYFLFASSFFTF